MEDDSNHRSCYFTDLRQLAGVFYHDPNAIIAALIRIACLGAAINSSSIAEAVQQLS